MRISLKILFGFFIPLLMMLPKWQYAQQNLVPNGSFELYDTCPNAISNIYTDYQVRHCIGWTTPTVGSSDYYNACAPFSTGISVPQNVTGYQMPFEGNAYCGLYAWAVTFDGEYKEYIQAQLSAQLEAGIRYSLTFWVAHANPPGNEIDYAVAQIGGLFSQQPVARLDYKNIPLIPQVSNSSNQFIIDTVNWTRIYGEFVAAGGEQYLTIGSFADSLSGDTLQMWMQDPQGLNAYYYVDSVTVKQISSSPYFYNVITPNGDGINDQLDFSIYKLGDPMVHIYNRWGNCVFRSNDNIWDGKDRDGRPLADGTYYYVIEGTYSDLRIIRFSGFIQLFNNP